MCIRDRPSTMLLRPFFPAANLTVLNIGDNIRSETVNMSAPPFDPYIISFL